MMSIGTRVKFTDGEQAALAALQPRPNPGPAELPAPRAVWVYTLVLHMLTNPHDLIWRYKSDFPNPPPWDLCCTEPRTSQREMEIETEREIETVHMCSRHLEEIYICSSRLGLIKMDHHHSGNARTAQQKVGRPATETAP
jgi:hypothetical protein